MRRPLLKPAARALAAAARGTGQGRPEAPGRAPPFAVLARSAPPPGKASPVARRGSGRCPPALPIRPCVSPSPPQATSPARLPLPVSLATALVSILLEHLSR